MAVVKSNTSSVYFTNTTNSKHGVKRERLSFSNVDIVLIIVSMVTVLFDLITDVILVTSYYLSGHTFWAFSTVALSVVPAAIIQAFSIRWHLLDGVASSTHWLTHCCLLGVFFRHIEVLQTGLEARRSGDVADFQLLFHQQSDICMLHLFESFMESAPQLVLQLYIMIQVHDWGPWTGISAAASLISLSWAIAAYTRAMRRARPDKRKATAPGLLLQAVWRAGMIAARVTALVLFSVCCQTWIFLLLGLHWLGMTVWVVLQKTDLCSTPWEECAYNCVVGVVYCFCFFNLREGRARGRMLAFYLVTVTQNLACLYIFLALAQHNYPSLATLGAGTIIGGTVVGLGAMLLYYRFFHPAGPITLFGPPSPSSRPSVNQSSRDNQQNRPPPAQPSSVSSVPIQIHVQPEITSLPQNSAQSDDHEKNNSLRSLKHLWSIDRDGSLSSRSDDAHIHSGSPQSDDGCTDKRLLLSSRETNRRPISALPTFTSVQVDFSQKVHQEQSSNSNQTSASNTGPRLPHTSTSSQSTANAPIRCGIGVVPSQLNHSSLTTRSAQSLLSNHSNQSAHSSHTTRSTLSAHSTQSNQHASPTMRSHQPYTGGLTVKPVHVQKESSEQTTLPINTAVEIDDSKLSWNCTSMMEDTQQSDTVEEDPPPSAGLNKRRGICSSVELGLDKFEEENPASSPSPQVEASSKEEDISFARLCQKLVNEAEVKQLSTISLNLGEENGKRKALTISKYKEEKRESDYIDSKQSAISSDGTASEVLSAHDYENICAVNIAREAWGLRSWRGYSDIETWLHDDSVVVRDRRRDTLASIGTTTTVTSASSERSTASESPPPIRNQTIDISAPPLPCRRPRPSYNRMDDYLDTLAYDLAEIELKESASRAAHEMHDNVFVAQPYVVDQNGMLYPLQTQLDTILEEMEESSVSTGTVNGSEANTTPPWASSLVATIDEIRTGTSRDDTVAISDIDLEVGSYRSLQLESNFSQQFPVHPVRPENLRFSSSLPSLLQAPGSWSHLTPEEVLFLSKLKPQPEIDPTSKSKAAPRTQHNRYDIAAHRKSGSHCRRKFSLLREKFESKSDKETSEIDEVANCDLGKEVGSAPKPKSEERVRLKINCGGSDKLCEKEDASLVTKNSAGQRTTNYLKIQNDCNAQLSPFKETDSSVPVEQVSYQGNLIKQVLRSPKFVPRNKKLALASNASA